MSSYSNVLQFDSTKICQLSRNSFELLFVQLQARSKTEATRSKAAQEAYKELQNVRQEALQKKKAERKKMMEEAEAKLGAEAIRKKDAKERARQMKKGMPKVKMTRAH